jgi:hypothetical protein
MKIVHIFAHKLFAFHYMNEVDNEYDRLMDLWNDTVYLYEFLKENQKDIPRTKTIGKIANELIEDAYELDERLIEITNSTDKKLSFFFQSLSNHEYRTKILSFQKGRQSLLRMYAIKIDDDTFVITGGAIKLPLHHLMEDRAHTKIELTKLNVAKAYFTSKGVLNEDSFFEFLNEENYDK